MTTMELLLVAVSLAMDAFSVAICKGLAMRKATNGHAAVVGLWFGFFQFMMPLIGWFLGSRFASAIARYDHWVAFALLGLIGGNMFREALSAHEEGEESQTASLSVRVMLPMAVATSIDALAVGITFSFLQVSVWSAGACIGAVTFALSFLGVKIGKRFGLRYQKKAEICGGVILVLLGVKILLEHLGVL